MKNRSRLKVVLTIFPEMRPHELSSFSFFVLGPLFDTVAAASGIVHNGDSRSYSGIHEGLSDVLLRVLRGISPTVPRRQLRP